MIKKWINNKELAYLTKYTRCFSRVTYPQMLNHYTSAQAALTLRHHCLVPLYLKFRHGHGTTALPTHPWARTCSDFLLFHHHTTRQVDRKWCSELSLTWFSIWFGLIWFDLIWLGCKNGGRRVAVNYQGYNWDGQRLVHIVLLYCIIATSRYINSLFYPFKMAQKFVDPCSDRSKILSCSVMHKPEITALWWQKANKW